MNGSIRWLVLGVWEADAIRQYQLFLAHAARNDPERKLAQTQLAALGAAPPDSR